MKPIVHTLPGAMPRSLDGAPLGWFRKDWALEDLVQGTVLKEASTPVLKLLLYLLGHWSRRGYLRLHLYAAAATMRMDGPALDGALSSLASTSLLEFRYAAPGTVLVVALFGRREHRTEEGAWKA